MKMPFFYKKERQEKLIYYKTKRVNSNYTLCTENKNDNKKTGTTGDSLLPALLGHWLFHRLISRALGLRVGCRRLSEAWGAPQIRDIGGR